MGHPLIHDDSPGGLKAISVGFFGLKELVWRDGLALSWESGRCSFPLRVRERLAGHGRFVFASGSTWPWRCDIMCQWDL